MMTAVFVLLVLIAFMRIIHALDAHTSASGDVSSYMYNEYRMHSVGGRLSSSQLYNV